MNKFSRIFLLVLSFAFAMQAHAQQQVEMADAMRSNGKIYVVVTVCMVILTGLFLYVWMIDRKITRIEKSGH